MTRDEVKALLDLRLTLTGDNYARPMLDTWTDELAPVPYGQAVVAMRRAARHHQHIQFKQFWDELAAHQDGLSNRSDAERDFDCVLCGGTGWKDAGPDRAGNTSVEPCDRHVQPDRTIIHGPQGLAIAAVACEEYMRSAGKSSAEIDGVINKWFGPEVHA